VKPVDVLKRTLPFVVTAAILAYLFDRIDLAAAFATLTAESASILIPAILIYGFVSLAIEGVSLARLTDSAGRPASVSTCSRIKAASYSIGMLNYALGIAALSVLFRRRVGLGLATAAGLVATVSVTDLAMLIAIAVVALVFAASDGPALQLGTVAFVAAGLAFGLVFLRTSRSLGPLERLRQLDLFKTVRSAPLRTLLELALLRIGFVFTFIGAGHGSMIAFGVQVPADELIVGMSVVALVGALPIAVAGLGTVQLATVELFGAYADEATLVACSLSMQAAMLAVRLSMGLVVAREFTREAAEATRSVET
jgi:hypothetical protein